MKILVAPLDWGLGHATRCIPIIQALQAAGCNVLIAANGPLKTLLQAEFPQVPFLLLPGYNIRYSATAAGLFFRLLVQIPRILRAIHTEQNWLKKVVEKEGLDAVISDNRYGLYSTKIASVFITHQLRIKAPLRPVERLLQRINYFFINRYGQCWVPDSAGTDNLAGRLAHPMDKPAIPLYYTGPLSRFKKRTATEKHLLIVLSGPEPQRSLLEGILVNDLQHYTGAVVLVRGLPNGAASLVVPPQVAVYNHLPAAALEQAMKEAWLVISRCGYSTVMDIAALQKKSVLVPTPGQTEQQYLAGYLTEKKLAMNMQQKRFNLAEALQQAQTFSYRSYPAQPEQLSVVVEQFIALVKARSSVSPTNR